MQIKLRDWQKEAATKCLNWYTKNNDNKFHQIIFIYWIKYSIQFVIVVMLLLQKNLSSYAKLILYDIGRI